MSGSRSLFAAAIFLAAFLLFLVEPMAAKQLLPALGGSAAVWITCLVFFQTALLLAYLYAHWLAQRSHFVLHTALLLLATASAILWTVHSTGLNSTHPIASIFLALGASIGLPFLMLGATSPLLQAWLARLQSGVVPWRLYALSNLASLLALALYPTLVEPHLTLHVQRQLWCCGFAAFALISALLAWKTRAQTQSPSQPEQTAEAPPPATPLLHKLLWVLLPMGAAMELGGVPG